MKYRGAPTDRGFGRDLFVACEESNLALRVILSVSEGSFRAWIVLITSYVLTTVVCSERFFAPLHSLRMTLGYALLLLLLLSSVLRGLCDLCGDIFFALDAVCLQRDHNPPSFQPDAGTSQSFCT